MHQRDRDDIKEHFNLTPQEKEVKLQEIDASEANITAIFRVGFHKLVSRRIVLEKRF